MAIALLEALFASLREASSSFATQRNEARDRQRDEIIATLDYLNELCRLHVAAINTAVEPAILGGDIQATRDLLWRLGNNPDFPTGYDHAKGILREALTLKRFRSGDERQNPVKDVLFKVTELQYASFLLRKSPNEHGEPELVYGSRVLPDGFQAAIRLRDLLKETKESGEIEALKDEMKQAFQDFGFGMQPPPISSEIEAVHSEQDVIAVVQRWCRAWQVHVQTKLYGHVSRSIATLEFTVKGMR